MSKKSPYVSSVIIWLIFSLAGFLSLNYYLDLHFLIEIFISINIATFLLFGLDKFQSRGKGRRVPEKILYLVTILGGPVGTIAGMNFFKHKTRKTSFQLTVWFLILVYVGIIVIFWRNYYGV